MRKLTTRWAAAVALALPLFIAPAGPAHAGDAEERSEIAVLFIKNYSSGEYAKLDAWYTKALREDARMPSGVYRANRMVRSIASGFGGASPPPPCAKEPCPRVNDAFWVEHQQQAQARLKQNPQSTLAAMTLASAYSKQAWAHRGGGYANTVRDEDMKKFQELNQQALRTLFASAEYGRKDPNWWSELLTYAQYGQASRQDYAKLAQDAIAAFPATTTSTSPSRKACCRNGAAATRRLPTWRRRRWRTPRPNKARLSTPASTGTCTTA